VAERLGGAPSEHGAGCADDRARANFGSKGHHGNFASGLSSKDRKESRMSEDDVRKELERLQAENERLKRDRTKAGGVSFRVSEKGAVSVYGLGRFPVTLYQEQWDKLLGHVEELRQFIEENRASLKKKEA
jgi:hypothetical protein